VKKFLNKILFGITLPQEYLCVNLFDFEHSLKVFVKDETLDQGRDITQHHLLIGYNPLIIAIDKKYLKNSDFNQSQTLFLFFRSDDKSEVASLKIKFIHELKLDSTICLIFECVKGVNSFTNHFNRLLKLLHYKLTADKKKNIFLAGNLYEQVKVAYSIPRLIYLASVGSNDLYNIYPTDLSGKMGEHIFIMSLRTMGKANSQVESSGKCLIAKMAADSFMEVYNAGRNHMKELADAATFEIKLSSESSTSFNLPIPFGAIQYYELEKIDKFVVGIHTIHFFRILNSAVLSDKRSILAHIHRDYAEWRLKNSINTNYFFRN
jgi:hypothetical protein